MVDGGHRLRRAAVQGAMACTGVGGGNGEFNVQR